MGLENGKEEGANEKEDAVIRFQYGGVYWTDEK